MRAARTLRWHEVYDYVPLAEARRRGKRPLKLEWIDTKKGGRTTPLFEAA